MRAEASREHPVASDAQLQQQLLSRVKATSGAEKRAKADAVHVVTVAEGTDTHAVVLARCARALERNEASEELW